MRLTPARIALIVIAPAAVLTWLTGNYWFAVVVLVGGAFAFLNARDWDVFGREPDELGTSPPKVATGDSEALDLGDELEDLLRSASHRATRMLEDTGRLEPFVMYETMSGDVRSRRVEASDPALVLARARETARAVDPSAPRVILVVPGVAEVNGRERRVVMYEAAERRFRERTLAFVQIYEPRRLIFPTTVKGVPIYVGDAPHALRYTAGSGR